MASMNDKVCLNSIKLAMLQKHLESHKASCDSGLMKKQSTPSEPLAGNGSLTSHQSPVLKLRKANQVDKPSCTPECLLQNKKMILQGNNSSSKINIQLTNIPDESLKSKISDQGSISRGQDFYEFWDSSKQDLYQHLLWLPKTGSPDLVSSSLNGFVPSTTAKSSFSIIKMEPQKMNLEKTSWPLCKYIVVDGTEKEGTKTKPVSKLVTMKLKLNPNKEQKEKLSKMAGCCRYTYNKAVAIALTKGSTHKSLYRIRNRIVTNMANKKANNFFNDKKWLLECPKSARQNAIAVALANIKACFSNLKANNITHFTAPFKKKKNEVLSGWTLNLDQNDVFKKSDSLYVYKEFLGEMKYYGTKQLHKLLPDKNPAHDPKIQKNQFGEYFLVLSVDTPKRTRNPKIYKGYAAATLDPGVRKSLVSYSPENQESFMMGKGHANVLIELLIKYDNLLSKSYKEHLTAKEKMRMINVRKRVFYLKKEFRDQVASFLAQRYDILLVPKLETTKMARKAERKLRTKVVRSMLTLGHSMIYNRIKEKCSEYGTVFMEVKEHYTSQTCPHCGCLNKCNEVYTCKDCNFTCDRDVVGAANIFLKAVRRISP